jgi:translation initiation factor 4E
MADVRKDENNQQEGEDQLVPHVPNPEHSLEVKHPLQNKWTLWYFKNDRTKDWTANLKVVKAFDTVEDFWGLFKHIMPASKLQPGCDYSLFKDGIQPMWEDESNKRGGRWLINLDKRQRHTDLDNFWLETLLCLIGESFEEFSDSICGATVNIRNKGDKLGVWTRDANQPEANQKIGRKLKEQLSVSPRITIGFQAHSDTSSKAGSTTQNRYTV